MPINTVRPYHQKCLTPEKRHKLTLSRAETAGLTIRDIHCPYCGLLVDRVFSDVTGHKMVYCRKCKAEYPVNLGYFRRHKQKHGYRGFHYPRQKR